MASVGELCCEMKDLVALIAVREGMPGDVDAKRAVIKNLIDSFCAKIGCVKIFNAVDALKLLKTLEECSATVGTRIPIQEAVDARLASGAAISKQNVTHHHPQKLTSQLTNYFTEQDVTILKGERTSLSGRMQVVLDRFSRIGLQWPHEQTIKYAVAAVALAMAEQSGSYPTYNAVFHMVNDFKVSIDSTRRPWDFGHIVEYPEFPAGLPQDIFKHAYDASNPPISFTWDRFVATAEHHVPLRKNSALLKKDAGVQPCTTQAMSSDPTSGFGMFISQLQAFMQKLYPLQMAGRKPRMALRDC